MVSDEGVFYFSAALVIITMLIAIGFGKCDMNSTTTMETYKICMAQAKDHDKCKSIIETKEPQVEKK